MIAALLLAVALLAAPADKDFRQGSVPLGLRSRCKALMDNAKMEMEKQTPEGFQAAIRFFDQVLIEDSDDQTGFADLAASGEADAKRRLHDLAERIRDVAETEERAQDWISAHRDLLRAAAVNPYDATIPAELGEVESRCRHELSQILKNAEASADAGQNMAAQLQLRAAKEYAPCVDLGGYEILLGDFPSRDVK